MKNYALYAKYYDLLYRDKNYSAEADYVAKRIRSLSPRAKTVLELGCGTGKHAMLLTKRGFQVFGIDQSANMVKEARKRGLACTVADMSTFRSKKRYDAVISLFHVMSYMTDNMRLISTFRNAHANLSKRGIFLFDVWYTPAVNSQKPEHRLKKMGDEHIAVTRTADPTVDVMNNLVNVRYTLDIEDLVTGKVVKVREDHLVRHFSVPEISLLAELTGFEVIRSEELITGNKLSDKTWGACFILRKQ